MGRVGSLGLPRANFLALGSPDVKVLGAIGRATKQPPNAVDLEHPWLDFKFIAYSQLFVDFGGPCSLLGSICFGLECLKVT